MTVYFPNPNDNGGCGGIHQSEWVRQQRRVAGAIVGLLPRERRETAVQAGGNVGIFPLVFADAFRTVLTFEPSPAAFGALLRNLNGRRNVRAVQAALGAGFEAVAFLEDYRNSGASHMRRAHENPAEGVLVDVVPLDYYQLRACDLLQLDVEGTEGLALEGARDTIRNHRPVIVVEINGLERKYHCRPPQEVLADDYGYRYFSRIGNDHVFYHSEDYPK
ncbi:MAG: FkbM family methyltransferase [Patescibacteria group bacterium]|nr:FkbM family methyltransferase [Patescibacteria group bacterium]